MERPKLTIIVSILSLFIVAGSVVTVFSMRQGGPSGHSQLAATSLGSDSDDETPLPIDPSTIAYRQTAQFSVDLKNPTALAVGLDDQIFVAGDKAICILARDGTLKRKIDLPSEPSCLTVGSYQHHYPGRIYVALGDHVQVFDPSGAPAQIWPRISDQARLTSICASEHDVFVADAGNRVVWHFDALGKLLDPIGQSSFSSRALNFQGNSSYFDLVVGYDDLLYIANTAERRVEGYTFQGDRESHWGRASAAVADFSGPENPAQLALLPDGRFVTAEQNPLRVKIYSSDGKFESVVCGPDQIAQVTDLAADRAKRILILNAKTASVRVFEEKKAAR